MAEAVAKLNRPATHHIDKCSFDYRKHILQGMCMCICMYICKRMCVGKEPRKSDHW